MKPLAALLLLALAPTLAHAQTPIQVTVDTAHPRAAYAPAWNKWGADEPNYVATPNGQKLLHELAALSPEPPYIRVHNLLTTGDGVGSLKWGSTNAYTEDAHGNPVYDWTITDRIFDAFRDAGVRPEVEIGFMPEALSTHPEPYRHQFPRQSNVFTGWSYPPKDYAKWSALVTAYAEHLHARYGSSVDTWLWEVWNEPDIDYWHGSPAEYDRLYDFTAAAVRKALPHARIGGPESTGPYPKADGTPGSSSEAFLRQFLEHCARGANAATGQTGAPLDFISFHPKGQPKVVNGPSGKYVEMDIAHQLRAVDFGMRTVASFPEWKHTPILMGESDPEGCAACGIEQNPQNNYRNGPLYGVSVAEATARTYELAERYGVNLLGSVTWAFQFENQPYFAGFRDLATNGIDKAVLNVFREWGMLGGSWLPATSTGALPLDSMLQGATHTRSDLSAVATRKGREVDVLIFNYDDRDLPAPPATVSIRLTGLTGTHATMQQFLVDRDHSNAYTAWQQMGSPQQPSNEQTTQLTAASKLFQIAAPTALSTQNHSATIPVTLARQGVLLLRITDQ
ncbi:beta-xylosidase [Acidipila sp. EB88]|nr:beta-xylosidase [Acidipila sp. EB88]